MFWIGDANLTEPQLYRHLRTINQVQMPKAYADDEVASAAELPENMSDEDMSHEDSAWEAVQFRHADGNVLAEVMPVLDESQFARLFGPARLLVFTAPDHPADDGSILYEAPLPEDAPPPHAGLLRLDREQLMGIEKVRLSSISHGAVSYLKDVAPDAVGRYSQDKFDKTVHGWLSEGHDLGVSSRASYYRWAYLNMMTGGKLMQLPDVKTIMTGKLGLTPDQKVDTLMKATAGNLPLEGR